jgi:hypothetical protein
VDLIRRRFKNPGKVSTIGHRVLKSVANAGTPAKEKGSYREDVKRDGCLLFVAGV